jgi:uncharacterized protein YdhG (YjbR/CyaY superfamily)
MKSYKSVDEYISSFPPETQTKLKQIRKTIKDTTPQVTEKISYGMPTFYLNGNLVHFTGYKKHIGFYPTPSGIKKFEKEISIYKHSKGAVQFPLDKKLPIALIKKIVKFRIKENTKI